MKIVIKIRSLIEFHRYVNNHYTLSKLSGLVSTKEGISSLAGWVFATISIRAFCCLGPSCWIISGNKSRIVLVYGSPDTIKVLFWKEA
jgi:hypothetical protein